MNNILEVKNLSKKYNDFELKNVSFELPKGMILGFIGENGAGKTTTIKSILNIVNDYTGEINVFGMNNRKNDKAIKEDIGIVLDDMFFPEILNPKDINSIMKDIYATWDSKLYFKSRLCIYSIKIFHFTKNIRLYKFFVKTICNT